MSFRLSVVLLITRTIDAAPGRDRTTRTGHAFQPRATDDTKGPTGLTVQVWAPLVAITVVIVVMIIFSCIKRRKYGVVAAAGANRTTAGNSTTELTASLLSGNSGATAASGRRTRRTQRTPSQISTRSLPAYMEDPADSEMVLVRGAREMEDPMPTVQEGETAQNPAARSLGDIHNQISTTSQTNLLTPESQQSRVGEPEIRPSFDTVRTGSEDSQHGLLQSSRHSRQPSAEEIRAMGDAPPYFEVVNEVDLSEGMNAQGMRSPIGAPITQDVIGSSSHASATSGSSNTETSETRRSSFFASTVRRSGFRSFASRLSQFMPSSSSSPTSGTYPESHTSRTRSESNTSGTHSESHTTTSEATTSSSPPPVSAITRYVPTHSRSGSGSTLTLSPTVSRVLPRSRSNRSLRSNASASNLTSPSVTSLGPISAPLPHTLVRTEYHYPKVGPTSEQMKFISSRNTMGKFGVPYGLAAQAQAMASREALNDAPDTDPPPFESPMAEAGPSAARPEGGNAIASSSGTRDIGDASNENAASDLEPAEAMITDAALTLELVSQLSNRDSIVTFQTAREALSSAENVSKEGEPHSLSRNRTPTPTDASLTITVDGIATHSVPTPPPTPPRQSLAVPAADVPSIVIAPASPAA